MWGELSWGEFLSLGQVVLGELSFGRVILFPLSILSRFSDHHQTSRSVSSVPWITPAIRRKIRKKNATHAKAKKSGSAKIRAKFETLRREIKADIRKQHDLYVNNLDGDINLRLIPKILPVHQ